MAVDASAQGPLGPHAVGWRRMAKSLGSSHLPTGLKRLTGGLECETYRLDLGGRHLVVKVLTKNGSDAATEFDNLLVVTDADVPTPVPVRLDDAGNWFGFPAIVMSALPGKPTLYPADVDGWIMGAAGGLAAVHDLDPGNARAVRAPRWQRWRPLIDRVGDEAGAVEKRLGQLYERAEGDQKVFSHDDYNPGNVLFHDGDLSGVVDWADITIEPAQAAVAQYRHLLAIHPGGEAPGRFLAGYSAASGRELADLPLWDILYGLRGVGPVDHWVRAFDGLGVTLAVDEINERSLVWIRRALSRSGI